MNRSIRHIFFAILLLIVSLPSLLAQESGWPRTLPLEQGTVTIYPLQVDEKNGDIIHFRAALAYRETADSEPVFGAGWFESRVEIDSARDIVHPTDLKVTATRFPDGTDDVQSELSAVLAQQSPGWNLDFSVGELQESLKQAEAEARSVENLNTAPPLIIYRDHPALLVSMDGDPVLRDIENSPYQAVINTPYPLIFDGSHYYLNAAKNVWYRADKATGPYQFDTSPPVDIAAMVNDQESGTDAAEVLPGEPVTAANAPEIVVSTEPAELVVTEGPAAFIPLVDDLLVLQNSEDDVFMHVGSQQYYIVRAGRWYHSGSLNGPWTYQAADTLPAAFANIPQDSNQADSRVYVAGTEEAREAVLDAHVPQTAAVTRGEVDIDVNYDGEPQFEPVDGTDLVYAQNTGSTVIESYGLYYLVEDGVWYVSATPEGPWIVADYRPQQVASILPSSPVYNVKYVHVYDSTPNVVYVGYTPGYLGSYVYHNTIFYGSGWNYRPWVSPYYYYPRFSTWGWGVSYNPWNGWNFGLSWGWGPFSFNYYSGGYWHHNQYWHHRHYGRWGPGGYRSRHHRGYGHGRDRYAHNGYGRGDRGRRGDGRNGDGRNGDGRNGDGRNGDGRNGDGRNGDGRNGDGRNGDGRNGAGGQGSQQRNRNLYRDSDQQARIADTRDVQRLRPGRRGDDARQATYTAPSSARDQKTNGNRKTGRSRIEPVSPSELRLKADVRDQKYAGKSKSGRNRTEPVSPSYLHAKADSRDRNSAGRNKSSRSRTEPVRASDIRRKADARDAGITARTGRLVADSSGTANRRAGREPVRNNTSNRDKPPAKGVKNRTTPAPPRSRQNISVDNASTNGQSRSRGAAPRSANGSSRRQQAGDTSNPVRQKSAQAVTTPITRPQYLRNSNSAGQRSSRTATAPARQSQPRVVSSSAGQQPPRVVSASGTRQSGNRPGSRQQGSRNSGPNNAAPARSAPRGGTQKASRQGNRSNGGSRRAGQSRPKHR